MNSYVIALAISISLGIAGQLFLKSGALQGAKGINLYFQSHTIFGLTTYFMASILYIYALKKIPLSVAFPCVSISYVIVSYLAHVIWGEVFGPKQLVALGFIGIGIYILSRSQ